MRPTIRDGLSGRNPTITVNGRSYEVTDVAISTGGNRLPPSSPLKPETAERIAKGVRRHLELGDALHRSAMSCLGMRYE